MKNVITLGKKQITEFLMTYNKGVKSTFGLQKSLHQFAQALGFTNWFFLESELQESVDQILSTVSEKKNQRKTDQYLAFNVRFTGDDYESAQAFLNFLTKDLRTLLESRVISGVDKDTLEKTLLKKLTDGYSPDELDMAPSFAEVMEWYDVAESIFEEGLYSYAFHYSEWDDALAKKVVERIIKPAFNFFKTQQMIEGEFLSAEIVREFSYEETTPL